MRLTRALSQQVGRCEGGIDELVMSLLLLGERGNSKKNGKVCIERKEDP